MSEQKVNRENEQKTDHKNYVLPVSIVLLCFIVLVWLTKTSYLKIFFLTILLDTVISPVGPDLLIIPSTLQGTKLLTTGIVAGLASTIAGVLGYFIGKKLMPRGLESISILRRWVKPSAFEKAQKVFEKHGVATIAIAALTPLPYSAACWLAGAYHVKLRNLILISIPTRIIHFIFTAGLGFGIGKIF